MIWCSENASAQTRYLNRTTQPSQAGVLIDWKRLTRCDREGRSCNRAAQTLDKNDKFSVSMRGRLLICPHHRWQTDFDRALVGLLAGRCDLRVDGSETTCRLQTMG